MQTFPFRPLSSRSRRLGALALVVAGLAGCGGADDAAVQGPSARASTLLDDEGRAMPSAAGGAWAGVRIASAAQAQALEAARGGDVLHATPACCGTGDLDLAANLVFATQAARALPDDTPTFVRGGHAGAVAALAGRLEARGLRSVFVVVD